MIERSRDLPSAWWAGNFEELDAEIARLAVVCQIPILQPGVIQRVLQSDATVRGADSPLAFSKLHDLLMVHLAVRGKSVDILSQSQTAMIESHVLERLKTRFADRLGS